MNSVDKLIAPIFGAIMVILVLFAAGLVFGYFKLVLNSGIMDVLPEVGLALMALAAGAWYMMFRR